VRKYTRKQGNSLWIDVSCGDVSTLDPSALAWPTNWVGKWDLEPTLTTATTDPLRLSGDTGSGNSFYKSATAGLFLLRIGSNVVGWDSLPVGVYCLTIQVENATVAYRYEEQCLVKIEAQGIL
jgi:hypothetical protein